MIDFILWVLVALNILNIITIPLLINRPRGPITPGLGAALIISSIVWSVALIIKLT